MFAWMYDEIGGDVHGGCEISVRLSGDERGDLRYGVILFLFLFLFFVFCFFFLFWLLLLLLYCGK